jgi:hypothetical protein
LPARFRLCVPFVTSAPMIAPVITLALALTISLAGSAAVAQERSLADLRSHYQQETDAVRKAKLVPPLADAEFREIHAQVDAGNISEAAQIAGQVRDEARTCQQALDAKGRDAEKHPDGYRQLQISVRESLRRVNDILVGLSSEDQQSFLETRKDLEELDRLLLHELFPGTAGTKAPPAPAKPKD